MKKYMVVVLCTVTITVSAFAFRGQTQPAQLVQTPQEQSQGIPDHIPYRFFFHQVNEFNKEAEKAEKQGKHDSAKAFRSWLKQDAELTNEEVRMVTRVAGDCENNVKKVDKKAKIILDARRAYYKDGKLMPGQELLPPSQELNVLQKERNTTILQCRDQLRIALGEQKFAQIERFITQRVVPTITVTPVSQPQSHREPRQ